MQYKISRKQLFHILGFGFIFLLCVLGGGILVLLVVGTVELIRGNDWGFHLAVGLSGLLLLVIGLLLVVQDARLRKRLSRRQSARLDKVSSFFFLGLFVCCEGLEITISGINEFLLNGAFWLEMLQLLFWGCSFCFLILMMARASDTRHMLGVESAEPQLPLPSGQERL